MPLSPSTLKSEVGDVLVHATEFVEVTESLPRRHIDRNRSHAFDVTQAEVPGLDEDESSRLVGLFVATNPAPDLDALKNLASRLGNHGNLQLAIDAVSNTMRPLGEYLDAYVAGSLANASMREFSDTLAALCAAVHAALDRAERALEQTLLQDQVTSSCIQLDARPHLSFAHIASAAGIKEDSIRTHCRRTKLTIREHRGVCYMARDDIPPRWLEPRR